MAAKFIGDWSLQAYYIKFQMSIISQNVDQKHGKKLPKSAT